MSVTELNLLLSRIKSEISLSDVIGKDLRLTKKGKEYVGNCPFHSEKTASFFVNNEKCTYYCFGCGARGDIVEYIMKTKGITFPQAVEYLANLAGISIPKNSKYEKTDNTTQKILEACLEFFVKNLEKNSAAKKYCEQRGIDESIAKVFQIGYCDNNFLKLAVYLKDLGFNKADILKSGIFSVSSDGQTFLKFGDRIIFPVFDKKGWPVGFGGRTLLKDKHPKYLNSSESDIFKKREILYAYNIASKNVSSSSPFIITEGYMDVVIMHKYGFTTTVASMGTSFTHEHLKKIWKYCDEPIVCFDSDDAGYNAMIRLAFLALENVCSEKTVKFCTLPQNHDPDSYLHENGSEEMKNLLNKSEYLVDFLWNYFTDQFFSIKSVTPEHIAKWKKNIQEHLASITDTELKKLYKSDINERIYNLLQQNKRGQKNHSFARNMALNVNKENKSLLREAVLLYTVLRRPSIVSYVAEKLSGFKFSKERWNEMCDFVIGNMYDISPIKQEEFRCETDEIIKIASNFCKIDELNDNDVLEFWEDVFSNHVLKKSGIKDFKGAKDECKNNLDQSTWTRLKALKMELLTNKKS